MELSEMLLGELTVEQYIVLIATFCGVLFGLIFIALCLFGLIKEIFAFIEYFFRKDKYKQRDFAKKEAYKYIAILKRQCLNAPTEYAFYLYYNRFIGAIDMASRLGLISCCDKDFFKLVNIRGKFKYIENDRAADEAAAVKESEER